MYLLAIDASTKSTGVAIFKETELIYYNCITASSNDIIKRIQKMAKEIQSCCLKKYPIEKIILEEVHPDRAINLTVTKALFWLQYKLSQMIHDFYPDISIEYILPNSWRAKCGIKTGKGIKREDLKKADKQFVKSYYNLQVNDDIADAICIGHANTTAQVDDFFI